MIGDNITYYLLPYYNNILYCSTAIP